MKNYYHQAMPKLMSALLTVSLGGSLLLNAAESRPANNTNFASVITAGNPALRLQLPAGAEIKTEGERTSIRAANAQIYMQIWPLTKARTLDEGVEMIPVLLATKDVTEFKASATNHITVVKAPALHLVGDGKEQDDGDPSQADVVVFSAGNKIFAACTHGEHRVASEVAAMFKVLESAKLSGSEK